MVKEQPFKYRRPVPSQKSYGERLLQLEGVVKHMVNVISMDRHIRLGMGERIKELEQKVRQLEKVTAPLPPVTPSPPPEKTVSPKQMMTPPLDPFGQDEFGNPSGMFLFGADEGLETDVPQFQF